MVWDIFSEPFMNTAPKPFFYDFCADSRRKNLWRGKAMYVLHTPVKSKHSFQKFILFQKNASPGGRWAGLGCILERVEKHLDSRFPVFRPPFSSLVFGTLKKATFCKMWAEKRRVRGRWGRGVVDISRHHLWIQHAPCPPKGGRADLPATASAADL